MMNGQNLFLVGPMGAGKTTIGKLIAKELGLVFYDSDLEIEKRTGVPISWIFDYEGEDGFRNRESQVLNELTQMSGILLSTGGGCILKKENRLVLSSRGFVIYLQVSLKQQLQRLKKTNNRPMLDKKNLEQTLSDLITLREPLYQEIADLIIDTSLISLSAIVQLILKKLEK